MDGARSRPLCPICSTPLIETFTKKDRRFWKCRSCRLEKIHPLPSAEELRQYYENSYKEGMYREVAEANSINAATALLRYRAIRPHVPARRWLDVGCANGHFVDCAARHGIQSDGIDISDAAVQEGRNRGISLHCSDVSDWSPPYLYDTIS